MGIAKDLIKSITNEYLPGFFNAVNKLFNRYILSNPRDTFFDYKAQVPAEASTTSIETLIGILVGFLIAAVGYYSFLKVLRFVLTKLRVDGKFANWHEWTIAAGLYARSVVFLGGMNPITRAHATREKLAVLGAILAGAVSDYGIGIEGFTWGIIDPTWEFVFRIGILTAAFSLTVWWKLRFKDVPSSLRQVIQLSPFIIPIEIYIWYSVENMEFFGSVEILLVRYLSS